jgi:hypothetical protein
MAYATLSEVQELIAQFPITASSAPDTTQATEIIADISDEVDVRLAGAGIAVPVDTPEYFLRWLGVLTGYGSAAAILKSMFPAAVGPGETPAYAFWEERYQAGLKAITDGEISAPDTPTGSGFVEPSTYLTRNPDTNEDIGVNAEPLFSIGKIY